MRSTRSAAQPSEDLESPFLDEEMTPRRADGELEWASRFDHGTRADETWATDSPGESLRGSEEEILGTTDDRTLVTDTLKAPHAWICAIDVMSENPKWGTLGQPRYVCRSRATGTLIGPRYVLTAAHVFGDDRQKALTLATVHTVSPARSGNNGKNPFGAIKSTAIRFPQPYRLQRTVRLPNGNVTRIPIHHPGDDYALLILEKNVSTSTHANVKGTLGYWGENPQLAVVKRLDPVALQNQDIIVVGYPGDTCGRSRLSGSRSEKEKKIEDCWRRRNQEWASTQWRSEGTVTVNADANLVFHTADTYDGQSGSPIGLYVDGLLHLVAIHKGPDNAQRNKGTPVTLRMLREVSAWINADAGYEAATVQNETLTIRPKSSTGRAKSHVERFLEDEDRARGWDASGSLYELEAIPGAAEYEDERFVESGQSEFGDVSSQEEGETPKALGRKLKVTSLPLHRVEVGGGEKVLTPGVMDPGIYDGAEKYKIAATLQQCVMGVMNTSRFRHICVALVDLTRDIDKPDFAGFNHKKQVFAASVPKIAAMLGAFQLHHDLRAAARQKGSKTRDELFAAVRADWAGTHAHPYPKAPELENVFADVKAGSPVAVELKSTGETKEQLEAIINEYNSTAAAELSARKRLAGAKGDAARERTAGQQLTNARHQSAAARRKLNALGFLERMRVMVGGLVPASNHATSTIVRNVGFVYIASALLQSGLYDPGRKGGLWLAADYAGTTWTNGLALGGGIAQSATTASLAAFMTLLAQGRLVSRQASDEMAALMKKEPNPTHPGIVSWFKDGLGGLKDGGLVKRVLSKLGAHDGLDDCTLIERHVDVDGRRTTLRYVAVGLRARNKGELRGLILELDKCVLANNGFTPAQGGHS